MIDLNAYLKFNGIISSCDRFNIPINVKRILFTPDVIHIDQHEEVDEYSNTGDVQTNYSSICLFFMIVLTRCLNKQICLFSTFFVRQERFYNNVMGVDLAEVFFGTFLDESLFNVIKFQIHWTIFVIPFCVDFIDGVLMAELFRFSISWNDSHYGKLWIQVSINWAIKSN